MLIHLIADYGPGDLAFSEVVSALDAALDGETGVRVHLTSVPSFDTISTGFAVAQLAGVERVTPRLVFANCAPREDRKEARVNNEGEGLLYAQLRSGCELVVVNSGHSLSFVREDIATLRTCLVSTGGSQFRSRDSFPGVVAAIVRGDLSVCGTTLSPLETIPAEPQSVIGYVDSFGNIKTTLRHGDRETASLSPGERVRIAINGIQRTVTVATGSFHVSEGDMAFAPGSSGYERCFWEIFQRGGSAWHTFGRPRAGAPVQIVG